MIEIKYLFKSIHFDIKKSVVVLFISEILNKILNFQEKDELLFVSFVPPTNTLYRNGHPRKKKDTCILYNA